MRLAGRTPLIFIDIPGAERQATICVLLYGHLDKQPEMTGWDEGLGPVEAGDQGRQAVRPRRRRRRLRDLRLARRDRARCRSRASPHARCVVLIEACEESGSYDLPPTSTTWRRAHRQAVAGRVPGFGLRQLRAAVAAPPRCAAWPAATLTVQVLEEGVHSGDASGIVPSSFRMLRQLLSRIEDEDTGAVLLEELLRRRFPPIASRRRARSPQVLGDEVYASSRSPRGTKPMADDLDRARAQPHLAPAAVGHRRRRPAAAVASRQRAAPVHLGEARACACRRRSTASAAGELLKEGC